MITEIIISDIDGLRLDVFLAGKLSHMSRSSVMRLLDDGLVTAADRKTLKKNHRVTMGETFLVTLPDITEPVLIAEDIPLAIAYEDDDLIVINKPRGMVVHPAPGHPGGTLVNALMHHCGSSLSGIGGVRRPGIVHRLDKDTSGLIICAKNDSAHLKLSEQLSDRSLSRVYEAVVHGRFKEPSGTVCAPIGRHVSDRKRMAVTDKNSRQAVTHYEVIQQYSEYCHVRCRLETGRTHQIRVHMAYIGHPVLGDLVYGRKKPEKGLSGQCLHARFLKFVHPANGNLISLESELPEYFQTVITKLGPPR